MARRQTVMETMLQDMHRWVPARCADCGRELHAIGDITKPLLVPPEDAVFDGTGPRYQCSDREECMSYCAQREVSHG